MARIFLLALVGPCVVPFQLFSFLWQFFHVCNNESTSSVWSVNVLSPFICSHLYGRFFVFELINCELRWVARVFLLALVGPCVVPFQLFSFLWQFFIIAIMNLRVLFGRSACCPLSFVLTYMAGFSFLNQ